MKFVDNGLILKREYRSVLNGSINNPFHPRKYGVGFMGIGNYGSQVNGKNHTSYDYWDGMLRRCYNTKNIEKRQSYIGCSVADEWHNFQNFAKWFEENFKPEYMYRWCVDKDILIKGNKVYSSETCAIVPTEINNLFTKNNSVRGNYPIGVHFDKSTKNFISQINRNKEVKHLGSFKTVEEAFNVYKIAKEGYIKEVADKWRSKITEKVYNALINYNVEITD